MYCPSVFPLLRIAMIYGVSCCIHFLLQFYQCTSLLCVCCIDSLIEQSQTYCNSLMHNASLFSLSIIILLSIQLYYYLLYFLPPHLLNRAERTKRKSTNREVPKVDYSIISPVHNVGTFIDCIAFEKDRALR
jgi:hypothetical protein